MAKYYTLLTDIGKARLAHSQAAGEPLGLATLAVGDANGAYAAPTEAQTALVREVWRGPVNRIRTDKDKPNWLVIEALVPETVGGWTVREVGVLDTADNLIAVGAYPETYKPKLAEGSGRDLYLRMILAVGNAHTVELKIDPAVVLATRKYVEDALVPFCDGQMRLAAAGANTRHRQIRFMDDIRALQGRVEALAGADESTRRYVDEAVSSGRKYADERVSSERERTDKTVLAARKHTDETASTLRTYVDEALLPLASAQIRIATVAIRTQHRQIRFNQELIGA